MRNFVVKAFDDYLSGTTNVYTPTAMAELLGSADRLAGSVLVLFAGGTGPTITIQFEHSFDGTRWSPVSGTPELNAFPVNSSGDAASVFSNATVALQNYVRLRIALGGTSPSGQVQVWLCGRSPNR